MAVEREAAATTGELFDRYRRERCIELRNRLVEDHLLLGRGFARRYARRGVALEDLEQVARMALIGAVERFDPELGVRFETFAGRTIDGELKRYFRDKAWSVRISRHHQDLGQAIRVSLDTLAKELGRSPTIPELAQSVGAEVDEVLAAMEAVQAYTAESIDAPSGAGEGVTFGDTLGTIDDDPLRVEDRHVVAEMLGRLTAVERQIVELKFFGDRNQRDIAREVGMSQMYVSRTLHRALATLRRSTLD